MEVWRFGGLDVEQVKSMKIYWALAVFAFVVLGAAAVWMGGLNQDEGWYLYAANMVAESGRRGGFSARASSRLGSASSA